MTAERDDILDLPSRKRGGLWQRNLFYSAIAFFAYYFAAEWLQWPLYAAALVLGLGCFAMVSFLRFRKYRHYGVYQYFYFIGHLTLLSGIGFYLLDWPQAEYFFWSAFSAFGLGLLLLWRKGQ